MCVVEIRTAASTVCKPHCPLCKNFAYAQCINYGGRYVNFRKLLFIGLKLALISRQPIKLCVTSDGRRLYTLCFGIRAGPITSSSYEHYLLEVHNPSEKGEFSCDLHREITNWMIVVHFWRRKGPIFQYTNQFEISISGKNSTWICDFHPSWCEIKVCFPCRSISLHT